MSIEQLEKEYNTLSNDTERWDWIFDHRDKVHVECDNDWTGAYFNGEKSEDPTTLKFDSYVGNTSGVLALFDAIGINATSV